MNNPPHPSDEEETFRDCLHKSLEAELGLNPTKDYIISGLSLAHHQAPVEWPGEETPQWVIVQFFPIQLYGQAARDKVSRLPNVQWLTLSEIAKGCSADGKPFDMKQRLLIERADLIPAYLK
ncbi:NUDIX domain-containing protein [bacterium]|nr:NUDIX domain-containing protein [bacterium]